MYVVYGYHVRIWLLAFVSIWEWKSHSQLGIWHLCVVRQPISYIEHSQPINVECIVLLFATLYLRFYQEATRL